MATTPVPLKKEEAAMFRASKTGKSPWGRQWPGKGEKLFLKSRIPLVQDS